MYIEKLNENQLEQLVKLLGFKKLISVSKDFDSLTLSPDVGFHSETKIYLNDFNCCIVGDGNFETKNMKYSRFMIKIFGEGYRKRYNEYVEELKVSEKNIEVKADFNYATRMFAKNLAERYE